MSTITAKIFTTITAENQCQRLPTVLRDASSSAAVRTAFEGERFKSVRSEIVNRVEVLKKSFVLYEFKTTVYNAKGEIVAISYSRCNTLERKSETGLSRRTEYGDKNGA